ncbi:hypothetical protein J4771_05800 [Candidatus Kaistella beijingensis]|uniref:hypothetical protein n=1 Tax=Candidatus Kaistella beijingensis TaxID=2820270 RepID=UPI001CC60F95|nr:hypothetical protein [Candidatus Kaistella beijingensis]UBB90853.1 hypothetical protein J4771_05800 [Candidatus Kaistella beijingensis]
MKKFCCSKLFVGRWMREDGSFLGAGNLLSLLAFFLHHRSHSKKKSSNMSFNQGWLRFDF